MQEFMREDAAAASVVACTAVAAVGLISAESVFFSGYG